MSCQKSGGPGSSGSVGGNTHLLTKEVIVGKNGLNVIVDSIVAIFQYNANHNLSQSQRTSISHSSAASSTISLTYNFTYAGNLLSAATGTYIETVHIGGKTYTASAQINITFYASGGRISSFVQVSKMTGAPIIPITAETGDDSAVLAYDGSAKLSSYTIYQKQLKELNYTLLSQQSFSYNGGNLAGSVDIESVTGIAFETVTTAYQYDSKIGAAPVFIFPGVDINSINDLSK